MATQATTTRPDRLATRAKRSSLMKLAWSFYRDPSNDRPFAACLKAAWAWSKKWAASPVAARIRRANVINYGSLIASPVRRHYGRGALVGGRQSHAYQASKMGR